MRITKHKHRWMLRKADAMRKGQLAGLSRGQAVDVLFKLKHIRRSIEQSLRPLVGRRIDNDLRDEVARHFDMVLREAARPAVSIRLNLAGGTSADVTL